MIRLKIIGLYGWFTDNFNINRTWSFKQKHHFSLTINYNYYFSLNCLLPLWSFISKFVLVIILHFVILIPSSLFVSCDSIYIQFLYFIFISIYLQCLIIFLLLFVSPWVNSPKITRGSDILSHDIPNWFIHYVLRENFEYLFILEFEFQFTCLCWSRKQR